MHPIPKEMVKLNDINNPPKRSVFLSIADTFGINIGKLSNLVPGVYTHAGTHIHMHIFHILHISKINTRI